MTKYHPLRELLLGRLREFLREPETVFWAYGFPLLLALGLGIAFRNQPVEKVYVDVQQDGGAAPVAGGEPAQEPGSCGGDPFCRSSAGTGCDSANPRLW